MAVRTYRYGNAAPVDDLTLQHEVNSSASVVGKASQPLVDIACEESFLDDLDDAMSQRGWVRTATDPVTPIEEDFVSTLDLISAHRSLLDLIHFIDDGPGDGFASGAFKDSDPTAFPTSEIWYKDGGKTQKIVELTLTYTGVLPTTEVWRMYDTDGTTVLFTVTDTITYSGIFEDTRTRTWV